MHIDIPDKIVERLKLHVEKEQRFYSVDEYIVYLLKQVVEKIQANSSSLSKGNTEEEEEKIKSRLRSLGYID